MDAGHPEPGDEQGSPVHLLRSADRGSDVEALADRLGARVGLRGVLADLDRTAHAVRVPAPAATHGFRWDREDMGSKRWWPQGITTSADAGTGDERGHLEGRAIVVTSAYAQPRGGAHHGSRLSFVDVTDTAAIRYRHVLLVEAVPGEDGRVGLRTVTLHAGGIVWHGGHVHVAGTARGFSSFRLDDIVRVQGGDATREGRPSGPDTFGYRYVLPVRFTYDARTGPGHPRMRYSFASVDRSATPPQLVAGEYAHGRGTTRLVRYDIDPDTALLSAAADGRTLPASLDDRGVFGMQGAAVVDGTWFVTTSRGRFRLGSLWVGGPGTLREHRWQLPVGPEDI